MVLAKVPQSALLPPDLVMAEMKAVGVMLEKATCIIIPCSTKSMSKPRRLVACGSDQSPLGPRLGRRWKGVTFVCGEGNEHKQFEGHVVFVW